MAWCDPCTNPKKPLINTDGIIAGMVATCITHPLDVLKIRLQTTPCPCSPRQCASQIQRCEGWRAFYCGLSAGLLRQATYTAVRLSVYDMLFAKYVKENYKRPSGCDKVWLGIYAGLCGGVVGNPSEVVLVRRVVEGCQSTPPSGCCRCPCTYYGTIDAFRKIVNAEGFIGLWRGTSATLLRSVILSIIYVGSCQSIKDSVKEKTGIKTPIYLCTSTAITMSLIAAILTSPIDVVKTLMVATVLTHPLDVLKIRLQMSPARCTMLHLATNLVRYEGCRGLYCGLTSGLLRQATYTATRLSVYQMLYCRFVRENCRRPIGNDKLWLAIYAGLCGGIVGNPSEVVLVRRVVEGCQRSPPRGVTCCPCPSRYNGTVDAIKKIICSEGFIGLWRGTMLTLLRSVILSTVYVGSYSQVHDYVKQQTGEKDSWTLRVYTAVAVSFIAAILTSPIDVVKTFYQASKWDDVTYKETLQSIVRYRGYRGLWKGFTPYFTRMAIHTIVTFMVLDYLANNSNNVIK